MTALRSATNNGNHERQTTGAIASDRPIRWATTGAVLCVAIVAAVVSYRHAFALVRTYGEGGWTAALVPLTVDGLIFASSMVLLHSARRQSPAPVLARCLLGLGITATLAANAAHGLDHGPIGAIVAAWPAVALVGTYELLMLLIRATQSATAPDATPKPTTCAEPDQPQPEPTPVSSPLTPDRNALLEQATEAFTDELVAGKVPSIRAIRTRLRVGQTRAQQARHHLAALVSGNGYLGRDGKDSNLR